MINRLIYIYQFLYKNHKGRYNIASFFPLFSVVLGCLVIMLVSGTMDSMERTIFKAIEVSNFTYQGKAFNQGCPNGLNCYIGDAKQYVISSESQAPLVVKIISLNKFDQFKEEHIKDYLIEGDAYGESGPEIIIGETLARQLNVNISDSIELLSPLDMDIATSYMPSSHVNISSIFSFKGELPLDYESNYAFMSNEFPLDILDNSYKDEIFISSFDNNEISDAVVSKYNLNHWSDYHSQLASALKIEKILYSCFGYFVILIAALSSGALQSLFIIRKNKQLALLKALGCKNQFIAAVFIVNAISVSLIGVLCGGMIYYVLCIFDFKYLWIKNTFFINFPDFSINFNFDYFLIVILFSVLAMIAASFYSIFKIRKIVLIDSLNNKL